MRVPPRDEYPKEALLYQLNKSSTPEVKPPRHWQGKIYYISKGHCMYQYELCKTRNNECMKVLNIPDWVDDYSSVALDGERMLIVGGNEDAGDKRALLVDMTCNAKVVKQPDLTPPGRLAPLPDLPMPLYDTGVVLLHNDLYVIGGCDDKHANMNSIYYLSPGIYTWQTKNSMPHAVRCPLVVQHHGFIYVLGGIDSGSTVSQYSIEDDIWKECGDMPEACSSDEAGVVVHENRIKVITVDKCLMYDDDTDTWTVQQYDNLGGGVKAFTKRGKIWAVVVNGGTYSLMSYDDVDNVWNSELERIDNAWFTMLFC